MSDFYKILGVDKNASQDDIKKAFKKAAVKWHPDRWSSKSEAEQQHAEEEFKKVNEANDVLSDPDKRARYDRFGDDWDKVGGMGSGGFDMDDIFSHFGGFGHNPFSDFFGGGRGRDNSPEPGESYKLGINISIEDIISGGSKEVEITVNERCKECHGSGGDVEKCTHCNGTGRIVHTQQFGPNQVIQTESVCPHCGGSGKFVKKRCNNCGGSGFVKTKRKLSVTIRPGVANGEKVKFQGMGSESKDPNGRNGDVYVQFIYNFDENKYAVQGNTIYQKLEIPYFDCILGTTKSITLPNGKTVDVDIPKCSKDGDKVNKIVSLFNFVFIISVKMPTTLSNDEEKLLKEIRKFKNGNN